MTEILTEQVHGPIAATATVSGAKAAEAPRPYPELPADAMIIVPVRNFVMFPDVVMPLTLGRTTSTEAAQAAVRESRPVGILTQLDAELENPIRSTCTAWEPSQMCCATSPAPTRPTI